MRYGDDYNALTIDDDGAQRHRGAALHDLDRLHAILSHLPDDHAGIRIAGIEDLRPLLAAQGRIGSVAAKALGEGSRAVRAVLFDKTAATNWALGWHQDRTIVVRQRIDVNGFGPWTIKRDMQHVAPPFDLLQRMVTLRVHLDDVPATNAPLLVAPGSHRDGRIPVDLVPTIVERRGICPCLADAGDIWAYATPILHASDAATLPKRRRVLQIDFAAEELPGGLQWLGV
jgi:ectoine hydroxylase-related dioxygenase (phytanoyl-CoA dioxygenase family)